MKFYLFFYVLEVAVSDLHQLAVMNFHGNFPEFCHTHHEHLHGHVASVVQKNFSRGSWHSLMSHQV